MRRIRSYTAARKKQRGYRRKVIKAIKIYADILPRLDALSTFLKVIMDERSSP